MVANSFLSLSALRRRVNCSNEGSASPEAGLPPGTRPSPASQGCGARTGGVRRPAGVAQRLSHRGSVSHFRQNATATHFDAGRTERKACRSGRSGCLTIAGGLNPPAGTAQRPGPREGRARHASDEEDEEDRDRRARAGSGPGIDRVARCASRPATRRDPLRRVWCPSTGARHCRRLSRHRRPLYRSDSSRRRPSPRRATTTADRRCGRPYVARCRRC